MTRHYFCLRILLESYGKQCCKAMHHIRKQGLKLKMRESLWNQVNQIYEKLQDEQSKFIFKRRLEYSLDNRNAGPIRDLAVSGDYDGKATLRTLIKNYEKYQDEEIVLFGAVNIGEITKWALEGYGFKNVRAFCDNDKDKQGSTLGQVAVLAVEDACSLYGGAIYLVIAYNHLDEIKEQLYRLGISEERIYVMESRFDVYGMQYFDLDILSDHSDGVFIDGGCLNLRDSERFLMRYPDARKVYAFEPDKRSYEYCIKRLEKVKDAPKIEILNKGLFDSEGVLCFRSAGGSSTISADGDEVIFVTSLDHFMEGKEKVTFIKLDIEGAEMEALEGARKTIAKDKPDLAICIYHKNSDILDILQQILDINPSYGLWLRHYSEFRWETVVYAIDMTGG